MSLDREAERLEQKELKKKKGRFGWKPVSGLEGGNIIRVLPFEHKVTKQDVREKLFPETKLGKTVTKWRRPITTYYKGDKNSPQERFLMNIVDLTEKGAEKKVEAWLAPKQAAITIGDYVLDVDYGESILGLEGRNFRILYDKDADPQAMYRVSIRDKELSKELDSTLAKQVQDFFDPEVLAKFSQEGTGDTAEDKENDSQGAEEDKLE